MIQTSCGGKNGKLNDTIEVSALWSIKSTGRHGHFLKWEHIWEKGPIGN